MSLQATFVENFIEACEASPLNYTQIALQSGYSPTYLRRLRANKHRATPLCCVENLAQTLNVSPATLLGFKEA